MADTNIPFPSTLWKLETKILGEVSNLKFFCIIYIYKMVAIFQYFFIMADTDILFLSPLGKSEIETLGGW